LLSQSLAGAGPAHGANRLARSNARQPQVAHYFEHHVMGPLLKDSPALVDFILQSSILELLCASLCDAVTLRDDAQVLLEEAARRGVPLQAVDPLRRWYAFNPLFAAFLREKLTHGDSQVASLLHQRASAWAQGEGLYVMAFDHALLAGASHRAARLFEDHILYAWSSGSQDALRAEVLDMCARIPEEVKREFPRLLFLEAWRRAVYWRFASSEVALAEAENSISRIAYDDSERAELEQFAQYCRTMIGLHTDRPVENQHNAVELLRAFPQANAHQKATLYVTLSAAKREQFDLADMERLMALIEDYGASALEGPAAVFIKGAVSPAYMITGNLDKAQQQLGKALKLAERLSGGAGPLGAIVALLLAEVHYERNETEQAQALIDQYLSQGTVCGFVDQLIAGWSVASRLHQLNGDLGKAESVLLEAVSFARTHDFDRLRLNAVGELVRLLLGQGRLEEVARLVRQHGIEGEPKGLLPGKGTTTKEETLALIWTRIALSNNQLAEAHSVAKHWRNFLEAAGAVKVLLRWEILMAHHALLSGDARAAQRLLRRAMALAVPGQLVRSFLDEGAWLEGLLRKQTDVPGGGRDLRCDAFAAKLLEAFDAQQGRPSGDEQAEALAAAYGSLSPREAQILSLVGGGLLNREIGERLGMTEGSVKWYLQQIYDKLGVRRRSQAMERAMRMSLIAG